MESIKNLPLYHEFNQIKKNWGSNSHFIIKSPTGSGKSIALPLLLINTGLVRGKVMVVQPRRLAARMLSKQVAKISGWSLGKEVGYQVRFDACCSEKTRILYVTDGIAEKKLLTGEGLDDVEVIILDEFHERSAQIDLCLSLALAIWEKSDQNLRIFVTSATLDLNLLENFIPQSISIELSQQSYPVEIDYSGPRKKNSSGRR